MKLAESELGLLGLHLDFGYWQGGREGFRTYGGTPSKVPGTVAVVVAVAGDTIWMDGWSVGWSVGGGCVGGWVYSLVA